MPAAGPGATGLKSAGAARGANIGPPRNDVSNKYSSGINRGEPMDSLLQDMRYGFKMLLKRPTLTLAALLTLALAIGATTVVFSAVNAVLLRPLPLNDPDRLMLILSTRRQEAVVTGTAAHADYLDWKAQNTVFEDLSTFYAGGFKITGMGDPED